MNSESTTISLGAQTSREDDRTAKHILDLRRLLREHCKGLYSANVKEFALVLRIGGEMQQFDFEGCERVRWNRKQQYITVDLGFPSRRWKGASDRQIREYLVEQVETGLKCCVTRLERETPGVDSPRLMMDFLKAKHEFLAPAE